MKLFLLLFLATLVSQSAFSQTKAQPRFVSVDLLESFGDRSINMGGLNEARISFMAEFNDPELTIVEDNLGNCKVKDLLRSEDGFDLVIVSFEPELDDGRNMCRLEIKMPSGKKAEVELFLDVND